MGRPNRRQRAAAQRQLRTLRRQLAVNLVEFDRRMAAFRVENTQSPPRTTMREHDKTPPANAGKYPGDELYATAWCLLNMRSSQGPVDGALAIDAAAAMLRRRDELAPRLPDESPHRGSRPYGEWLLNTALRLLALDSMSTFGRPAAAIDAADAMHRRYEELALPAQPSSGSTEEDSGGARP